MSKCDPLESLGRNFFGGGIELAIRFSSFKEWVPLTYVYISGDDTAKMRGFRIHRRENLVYDEANRLSVNVCGFDVNDTFRIRWLQTSFVALTIEYPRDVWSLDDISVYVENGDTRIDLIVDSFENITQRYIV